MTVEEVRRILAGDRPSTVSVGDAELVRGYREAMSYVQSRADDPDFEWSPELLKAIQHRAVAGRRAEGAGKFGGARVVTNDTTGELVYEPPQEGIDALVRLMCEQMKNSTDHPAIQGAWIHVAFSAIHPFKNGTGRTARILASLAMYRGAFRRAEFTSLEEWWGRHRDAYYGAFACLGSRFNENVDVTPFIRTHVSAQLSQVRALAMRERVNREIWAALTTACHSAGIPDRAAFALWDAYNGRDVTRPYYLYLADISDSAATQDLASMRAAGLLAPVGRTRGRHYVAGPRLFRAIAAELGLRGDEVDHDQIVRYVTSYVSEHPVEIEAPTTTEALLPELVATPTTSVVQWPRGSTRTGEPQH